MLVKAPTIGTPLGNNILVKPDLPEQITEEGVVLPSTAVEDPHIGEIVALGPEAHLHNDLLKKGARVMWLYSIPTKIEVDGEGYILLDVTDIGLVF